MLKKIKNIKESPWVNMGPVRLKQAFPTDEIEQIDPFLLLHHYGPFAISEFSNPFDLGPHPHRGFEPITLLFKGEQLHRDSLGNEVLIKAGDVQWLTAGRGIIHAEGPTKEFVKKGGDLEGIQQNLAYLQDLGVTGIWITPPVLNQWWNPDKNFIGVDIKGARMFIGAEEALNDGMKNVAFLRTRIDFITDYFADGEVDEIWLTFSDPQPKKPRKRLTSKMFMDRFKQVLKPDGVIHLKTDSDILFESTEEQIAEHKYKCETTTWDVYGEYMETISDEEKEVLSIKTNYEEIFSAKGYKIKYCQIKF